MPDGAAETGRAALEETAGRAAARMVRGLGVPAGARIDVTAATPARRVFAIATLISSVDTTRRGFPRRVGGDVTHHLQGCQDCRCIAAGPGGGSSRGRAGGPARV